MTAKEKKELLSKGSLIKSLTKRQILKLIWWELSGNKKPDKFYEGLKLGKSAKFAFLDSY